MVGSRKAKPTVRPRKRRAAPAPGKATGPNLKLQLSEARAQQAATAEILKVIARSPADVQPVLDAIGRLAERLCKADVSVVSRFDGEHLQLAALHGVAKRSMERVRRVFPMATDAETVSARAFRGGRVVHVFDVLADRRYGAKGTARAGGWRGALGVPMLREGKVIGVIFVARSVPGPFSEAQIALLSTFADQAVIAIENVRLFSETREALERQTATAEILNVIASSPSNVQPVFDAIANSAYRLIGGFSTAVARVFDDVLHLVAFSSTDEAGNEALKHAFPMPVSRSKAARTGVPVSIGDTEALPESASGMRELARTRGFRSILIVPMLRDGAAIGTISVTRREPADFSTHQVDLLKTFADQAVIAIENVRLFNETREAFEQQKASADVLEAISGSMTDTTPVFDRILDSCERLFAGNEVGVTLATPDGKIDLVAYHGRDYNKLKGVYPLPLSRESGSGVAILDAAVAHYADVEAAGVPPGVTAGCRAIGMRSIIFAPMLYEGRGVGAIWVGRANAGEFAEKQIGLLRTFADQAVIAIQNARLFNETKEALERQTATAEILKVIASSPSDVQPVFEAIVRNFVGLSGGLFGAVFRFDGKLVHFASAHGFTAEQTMAIRAKYPVTPDDPSVVSSRAILTKAPVVIEDIATDRSYDREHAYVAGWRRIIAVPMLREGMPLGAIVSAWTEPGPIPQPLQDLLKTFADQAVIAIENVRLFNETKEALERQTATAEVLRVISNSPTDTQPVFEAIAASGLKLFADAAVGVALPGGENIRLAAIAENNAGRAAAWRQRFPIPLTPEYMHASAILERRAIDVPDVEHGPREWGPGIRNFLESGYRAIALMPMMRAGAAIGVISVIRRAAGPLSERQMAVLKTFADQAVIAIENVRLFNETKEALERQTATAEILEVIAGSPSDVQPVLDAVAERARRLCNAPYGNVLLREGGQLRVVAVHSDAPGNAPDRRNYVPLSRTYLNGRAVLDRAIVHVADVTEVMDAEYPDIRQNQERFGFRATLSVPLMREGEAVGAIWVWRREPGLFSEQQVALLQTFADQAVIAIENVRLFNETREALERQTATAEILRVISSSPTDVQPVFDAIVQSGLRLFSGTGVGISIVEGTELRVVATAGNLPSDVKGIHLPITRESASGMAIVEKCVANIRDTEAPGAPLHSRDNGRKWNYRSQAMAPMFREGEPVGVVGVTLKEPGGLDDKQITLLRTFADQAVIAIENVRLFKELQQRTDALTRSVGQLTALGEVGQAISSTLDLETVLQTIVSRAVQLTGVEAGAIYEYDEQAEAYRLQAAEHMAPELVEAVRRTPIRKGDGATGRTAVTLEPVQVADIQDASYQGSRKDNLVRTGYRAVLAVPLLREDHLLGALQVFRRVPGEFAPEVVELLKTFATQSAMAIQNARLFREIAEKGRQLEEASRHKSDFLASMSHELRTPLNAILGFNEMILGQVYGDVPADMKEPLEDIQKSGKHLLRLINNVLDLAKIEAGRMELSVQDYSVQDTVESVRATLRPLAAEKGLEFRASVPGDLPIARGDGGRIAQCLMNLAGNSLKFTRAGKVEIEVALEGDRLRFGVTDTGIGIPADKIGSLFTEFKQTDASIASEYGGTGLGLSITKKFIEMHGGRIWVESEPGTGSTFLFEVPLRLSA